MRCFIAVNFSDEVKSHIADFMAYLKEVYNHHHIVWNTPNKFHITLEFLGEITTEQIKIAQQCVASVTQKLKSKKIIRVELFEYDAFPSKKRPRVLIIRGRNNSDYKLTDIQRNLHNVLLTKGFVLESRLWQPHVSVGRAKDPRVRLRFDRLVFQPVRFRVESIYMMQSIVYPEGSRYSTIKRFTF